MPISVECSRCGGRFRAPDEAAGRRAKCPACGAVVPIPVGAPTRPADPPEPTRAPAVEVVVDQQNAPTAMAVLGDPDPQPAEPDATEPSVPVATAPLGNRRLLIVLAASIAAFLVIVSILWFAFLRNAGRVNIVMVHVGNAGNAADTTGYGAVGYDYFIGKYEVTAEQYTAFLNAVAGTDTYGLYNTDMWTCRFGCKIERYAGTGTPDDPYRYRVASDCAKRPVNYVSWHDAARFVNWLNNGQPTGRQDPTTTEDGAYDLSGTHGKAGDEFSAAWAAVTRKAGAVYFIPTEAEWYKAAYYTPGTSRRARGYWQYPTNTGITPGRDPTETAQRGNNANYCEEPLVRQSALSQEVEQEVVRALRAGPFPIESPHYTTTVGEFEFSESPCGTFDQGGNVSEWTETKDTTPLGPTRSMRGGSFGTSVSLLQASSHFTPLYPSIEVAEFGFRVGKSFR